MGRLIKPSFCTRQDTEECPDIGDIVCGFTETGEQFQYMDKCTACKNEDLVGYYGGFCLDSTQAEGLFICAGEEEDVCTEESEPVCGYSANGDAEDYGNSCTACRVRTVMAYEEGECDDSKYGVPVTTPQREECTAEDGELCTSEFDPVVGFNEDNESFGMFTNSCFACTEEDN